MNEINKHGEPFTDLVTDFDRHVAAIGRQRAKAFFAKRIAFALFMVASFAVGWCLA